MQPLGTPPSWASPPQKTEEPVFSWSDRLQRFAPALLRIFLSLVFLWFGFTQLQNSQGWVSYLPQFLLSLPVQPTFFIFLNGAFEVLLGTFLLLGVFVRPAAFLLGVHLLGITASLGVSSVGVRDFGLSFAMIAVSFYGDDFYTLTSFIKRKGFLQRYRFLSFVYNALLILLAGLVLVSSFYIFLTSGVLNQAGIKDSNTAISITDTVNVQAGTVLSLELIARHNKKNDCWVIINNKVYNVTQYIPLHPGGENRIVNQCGKESTTAFGTKGGVGGDHSASAKKILEGFYVGEVGRVMPSVPVSTGKTATNTTTVTTPVAPVKKPTTPTTPIKPVSTGISLATLATHNTQSNCWLLISGKVYDVTQYIPFHPGGVNQIATRCGTDATTAFNTKGGSGGTHSTSAKTLLAKYYVGDFGVVTPVTQNQIDTTPPSVSFSSPSSGAVISGTVTISATASDLIGMTSVRFSIDGTVLSTDFTSPYSASLVTTNYTDGTHTLTVLATDINGNTNSATVVVTITNQTQNQNTNTGGTLTLATLATHNTQSNCWLLISGKVYDVTQYIPFHPGGVNQIATRCGTDATTAFNTKGGSGGSHSTNAHTLLAGYYVGDLGTGTVPTQNQNDTTPPAISFSSPSSGATVSGTVTLSASASDAGGIASVRFSIDGAVLATDTSSPYSVPLVTTNYTNGSHTLTLLATDSNGNTNSATLVVTVSNQSGGTTGGTTVSLTMAELATHNTQSNCWLLISGKIYDVTQYIPFHPGGTNRIVTNCGTDATTAFNTRGGTGSHSTNAHTLLAGYYLGDLGSSTTTGGATGGTTGGTVGGTTGGTTTGTATTYTVTTTSTGVISPASLTVKVGDTVNFTYTNPNNEVILTFSPSLSRTIKLDKERTSRSYTFSQAGTYTYHKTDGGVMTATIVVQ